VSSVSSAVIQVPGMQTSQSGLTAGPAPIELPPRSRSRVWIGGAAAGVLLVVGVVVFMSMHNTRNAAAPGQDKSVATQAPVTTAAPTVTQTSQPLASAPIATTDTATPPSTAHAGGSVTHVVGTFPKVGPHGGSNSGVKPVTTATSAPTATTQPTQTAAPTSTVDDISKNPYR
jgi:hypothetical protein